MFRSLDRNKDVKRLGWLMHAAGLLVAVMLFMLIRVTLVKPLQASQADKDRQALDLRDLLAGAGEVRDEYARLHESLEELESLAKAVRERIPERANESEFLAQITAAAAEQGMKISNFHRGEPSERDTHSELPVHFTTSGAYEGVARFLHSMLKQKRVVKIDKLTIRALPGERMRPAEFELLLYFGVKQNAAAAAGGADGGT